MPHRLPVHADRAHLRGRAAAHARQFVTAHRVARGQRVRRKRRAFQFVVAGRLKREQGVAQAFRKPDVRLAEHGGRLAGRELDGDAIDAVHARAGHQTEVHAVRLVAFDCLGPSSPRCSPVRCGFVDAVFRRSLARLSAAIGGEIVKVRSERVRAAAAPAPIPARGRKQAQWRHRAKSCACTRDCRASGTLRIFPSARVSSRFPQSPQSTGDR